MPVYSQAGGNKEFSVRYHSLDVCSVARSFLDGEGDGAISSQREEIPRQILQGSLLAPSSRPHLRAGLLHACQYINQYPILQHFITSSPLHGVTYSSQIQCLLVPSRSIVMLSSTRPPHKAPSSKPRHCRLIDNALRSISIISMTTEPGTILIEAFQ